MSERATQFGPISPANSRQLFGPDEIRHAVDQLGLAIRKRYGTRPLTVVVALKGALVFSADLIRRLDMPVHLMTVTARSYRGADTTPGALELSLSDLESLSGRDVLIVDDILDTGRTLSAVATELRRLGPASLSSVVLLDKPSRRQVDLQADFVGFTIEDHFVVGYGLDHDGLYRNLPFILALETIDSIEQSGAV